MSYNTNKTYPPELTFEQIQDLIEKLPEEEKITIAKNLGKETFNKRLKTLTKNIKQANLSEEEIIKEVKSARKEIYERKTKTGLPA